MDLAEAHIRNAGYGRFSFRDLAAEIGIKSASVHHHFPTKATMAAAVARRYGDRFLAAVARRPNESAGDAISVYRLAFREALSRPGLTSGIGTSRPRWPPANWSAYWGSAADRVPTNNCAQHCRRQTRWVAAQPRTQSPNGDLPERCAPLPACAAG